MEFGGCVLWGTPHPVLRFLRRDGVAPLNDKATLSFRVVCLARRQNP